MTRLHIFLEYCYIYKGLGTRAEYFVCVYNIIWWLFLNYHSAAYNLQYYDYNILYPDIVSGGVCCNGKTSTLYSCTYSGQSAVIDYSYYYSTLACMCVCVCVEREIQIQTERTVNRRRACNIITFTVTWNKSDSYCWLLTTRYANTW